MESDAPSAVINMYIVYIVKQRDTFTMRRGLTSSEIELILEYNEVKTQTISKKHQILLL